MFHFVFVCALVDNMSSCHGTNPDLEQKYSLSNWLLHLMDNL